MNTCGQCHYFAGTGTTSANGSTRGECYANPPQVVITLPADREGGVETTQNDRPCVWSDDMGCRHWTAFKA